MAAKNDDRTDRAASGRYDRLKDARLPAGGVGVPPKEQRKHLAIGAVADAYETDTRAPRFQVAINTRVDILELELSRRLISQAAYLEGRNIQALLEKMGGAAGSVSLESSRGDAVEIRERKHETTVETIRQIQGLEARIVGYVGMRDWRIIRWVIGDRLSYADIAEKDDRLGQHGRGYVGQRFRDAIETLAEARAARGKAIPMPADEYLAMADRMAERQVASIKGGATREGYEAELAELNAAAGAAKGKERGRLQEAAFDLEVRLARMGSV